MKSIFRNKNFVLLFSGNLVSQIGTTFYNFAISWFILSLTESAFQAGAYLAFGAILQALAVPLAGVFVDRLPKVKILVGTDALRGLVVLLAGFSLFILRQDAYILFTLYVVSFVLALNHAFFSPAAMALRPEIVKDEELNQCNAFFSMIGSVQAIIGVLLGGILYTFLGIELIFILNGATFLVSAVSEMFIRTPYKKSDPVHDDSPARSYWGDFKTGLAYIKAKSGLIEFMLIVLVLNFTFVPLFANVLPYLFNLELGRRPLDLSMAQMSFSFGILAGSLVVGAVGKRLVVRNALRQGLSVQVLFYLVIAVLIVLVTAHGFPYQTFFVIFALTSFCFAVANMWVNIPINTGMLRAIDADVRGRVLSIIETFSGGLVPLAVFIGGIAIDLLPLGLVALLLFTLSLVPYSLLMLNRRVDVLLKSL